MRRRPTLNGLHGLFAATQTTSEIRVTSHHGHSNLILSTLGLNPSPAWVRVAHSHPSVVDGSMSTLDGILRSLSQYHVLPRLRSPCQGLVGICCTFLAQRGPPCPFSLLGVAPSRCAASGHQSCRPEARTATPCLPVRAAQNCAEMISSRASRLFSFPGWLCRKSRDLQWLESFSSALAGAISFTLFFFSKSTVHGHRRTQPCRLGRFVQRLLGQKCKVAPGDDNTTSTTLPGHWRCWALGDSHGEAR
ncbi:hypothetical protein B0T26DRAFT_368611 [Lasiosphaeria miniovina]|uniref:Uncharacterized protein n=1 Tax=Lasiosphaeria miniovina TaxID=1954250 RepID=A0AA40DVY7_9PEZI|nr:uncharacterized protein B0T26DRAFT_368611 [Lasiosphaeria miniovina]KAK0713703.1 hypothetical protein B0T26DRAFT_368611 [Lasiosphaeria miniovina]